MASAGAVVDELTANFCSSPQEPKMTERDVREQFEGWGTTVGRKLSAGSKQTAEMTNTIERLRAKQRRWTLAFLLLFGISAFGNILQWQTSGALRPSAPASAPVCDCRCDFRPVQTALNHVPDEVVRDRVRKLPAARRVAQSRTALWHSAPDKEKQRRALLDLYNSTDGDHWFNKANWKNGSFCTWAASTATTRRTCKLLTFTATI